MDLLGSGFGVRDGRGSDPGENSAKKISTHSLNGICGWIWTPGRIQGKIVLRKSVLIFLTVFAAGFGLPGEWIWSPGWEGGRIQGKIVLRKSVLIFLTVFADGFGPLGSGFGARDGRGSDPGENSVKKISIHFLNGICGWIWTPRGMDLEPGMGWSRIQGKIVLRKSVLIFLTVFADGFGPPGEWIWSPGWEGVGSRGK